MPQMPHSASESLLSRLRKTPETKLRDAVVGVEGITPEQISKWEKLQEVMNNGHWKKCKNKLQTCLTILIALSAFSIFSVFLNYLYTIWGDTKDIEIFLKKLLEYAFVSLATLYTEDKINKKDNA